jgi:hypothetical protein
MFEVFLIIYMSYSFFIYAYPGEVNSADIKLYEKCIQLNVEMINNVNNPNHCRYFYLFHKCRRAASHPDDTS